MTPRQRAQQKNDTYYHGKPCYKCGSTLRYVCHRYCVKCKRAKNKARYDKKKRASHYQLMFRTPQLIISKQDALRQGLMKYYTGKPCSYNHLSERYVKDSVCCACKLINNGNPKLYEYHIIISKV